MAQCYPKFVPESIRQDPSRDAEVKVYTALATLPDPFHVFYSVKWLVRHRDHAQDGEADFVVAHPELGVLVIEVKGGSIAFDAKTNAWTSTSRAGTVYSIKDPVEQARKNKYALLSKLQELPGWHGWITLGHAVAFPDIETSRGRLRPDLPQVLILDRKKLQNAEQAIRDVFAYWRGEQGEGTLGVERLQQITHLLARSFELRTPLGVELDAEDERIVQLTQEQLHVLDMLQAYRRLAVKGCAGSGKTMLALEKARRLASEGFNVLLTCYNIPLADYLAQHVPENVDVFNFHRLCETLIKEADIFTPPPRDQETYYNHSLPENALDAIAELGPRYDAIIVDEGQDFREEWWVVLSSLLYDEEEGIFYVFFDDNQMLYEGRTPLPHFLHMPPPLSLTRNCRNTQAIHRLVRHFHPHGDKLKSIGPPGRAPIRLAYSNHRELHQFIRRTLHELINENRVSNEDIVILTPRGKHRSSLSDGLSLGNFTLVWRPPQHSNEIQVSTVHRFKGLERKVVILAEVDPWAHRNPETIPTLLYVACSRARTHLIIFHNHRLDWQKLFGE